MEQCVIHRLPARFGAGDKDREVVLGRLLTDELGQALWPQGGVRIAGLVLTRVDGWVSVGQNGFTV